MGVMRFVAYPEDRITADLIDRVYLAGSDTVPWECKVRATSGGFSLRRTSFSESGNLHCPWNVRGRGQTTIVTGTLIERDEPYHLQVELARGKLNQVREHIYQWELIGLVVPEALKSRLRDGLTSFSLAATSQHDIATAAQHAEEALSAACQAAEMLTTTFVQQSLAARHRQTSHLPVLLGVNLGSSPLAAATSNAVLPSFNSVTIPVNWHKVESTEGQNDWTVPDDQMTWAKGAGLKVIGGPLLQFDRDGLPDWLYLYEGDFQNLTSFIESHVRQTVERYKGKVDFWLCGGRFNSTGELNLTEEDKLRMVFQVVEVVGECDPDTPKIIRFDQPWGEYLRNGQFDLSPIHIADHLTRVGLGVGAIDLEINLGYYPDGTYPRDLLDVSRLVDLWSLLNLPLFCTLTIPSGQHADPNVDSSAQRVPEVVADVIPGGWTPDAQRDVAENLLRMLLAKPSVQGVSWNQLRDGERHLFPHSGLVDGAGRFKPAFGALGTIRTAHLI